MAHDETTAATTAATTEPQPTAPEDLAAAADSLHGMSAANDGAGASGASTPQAGFEAFEEKMLDNNMSELSIQQFHHLYTSWKNGSRTVIPESTITPIKEGEITSVAEEHENLDHDFAMEAFRHTAFLKLNGGLGTSMGLEGPKSLLPVRRHKARQMRFIDIIMGQVIASRIRQDVPLPLVFMNSFRTSGDTLKVMKADQRFRQENVPWEIVQHTEPKIDAATGAPAQFPENHELEWCPPGHGDVFSTIWESHLLDSLQAAGMEYLFISNSDNLGARPSSTLAGAFAKSGAPFMVEVSKKTPSDRKGGQIVRDRKSGQLMLREISQVPESDLSAALNYRHHRYFNTNNIWVRVDALKELLAQHDGVLDLPIIVNHKTVDPSNKNTEKVIQLETAMGAAISLFPNATCIEVNRSRFLPVKTTNDLFVMRSDRFHLTDSFEMEDGNYVFPDVKLDPEHFKNIQDFDDRFPYGVPSIAASNSVTVDGDWYFGRDVSFYGDAHLPDYGHPSYVPNGSFVGPQGIEPDEWI